ncbi:hypothetical protein BGZ46_006606, partial [Entomortierella lignicola]
ARALGYIVVGVNEFYTSKKCPTCQDFVAQTESIRRLWCSSCEKLLHRDVMAGNNMCNAILGHLKEQQRPLYLQPVTADGSYPWMEHDQDISSNAAASNKAGTGKKAVAIIHEPASKKSGARKKAATNIESATSMVAAGKKRKVTSNEEECGNPSKKVATSTKAAGT